MELFGHIIGQSTDPQLSHGWFRLLPQDVVMKSSRWWLQPFLKIGLSNWVIAPGRGENKTYLKQNHLESYMHQVPQVVMSN